MIINPPTDQTVLERMEVIFNCEGQANPGNLSVSWYKGNLPVKSIDEGALSERASVRSDGALVISTVLTSDKGTYTCEVTNGIGQPITASANLVVHCKFFLIIIKMCKMYLEHCKVYNFFMNSGFETQKLSYLQSLLGPLWCKF